MTSLGTETVLSGNGVVFTENVDDEEHYSGKDKLCSQFRSAFVGFLFPKVTPIKASTFLLLTFLAILPTAIYVALFTKMGYGMSTYYYLSENYSQYGSTLFGGIVGFSFILYLLDCHYWVSPMGVILRRVFVSTLVFAISVLGFVMSGQYPFFPGSLFIVYTTVWMTSIQKVLYKDVQPRTYVSWLSGPLFTVSVITFIAWLAWTFAKDENEWSEIMSLAESETSGCQPDFDKYPDCEGDDGGVCWTADTESNTLVYGDDCEEKCTQVFESCYNTFLIWAGPFMCSLGLLFLSFFATFLRSNAKNPEHDTSKFARVWMFLLFAVWVGASLSGAGAGVSTTLGALTLASFIAAAVFLAISFNIQEREEQLEKIGAQLKEKYGNHFDIFRGLLIVTISPVFLIYFGISFVIQRIRRAPCVTYEYSKPPENTQSIRHIDRAGWFTTEARRLIREFQSWNRTKVFVYGVYWGLAFMILYVVVAQFTLVFLSWLIEVTSAMPLAQVTGILVGIGMTMFLLPPVPGVPIYLTLGIVIIPVGREVFGVTLSILYALGVSLCLKLLACTLQQKMIGGLLQHKVSVRQFCGVNSNLMRSMKLVLMQPGLGIDKVSILVGGPDWPTSVLCGIMGLDLIPILVGTLPIIFLITPTLLSGTFLYMSSVRLEDGQLEFPWAGTLATICTAITALVQFGSMVVAAFYLEKTVSNRQHELEDIPIDEEVKEADEKDEEIREKYDEVTTWKSLPLIAKVVLALSLICMITSCYMVQFFSSLCFVEYQLTYTIADHLDGDWKNIVMPLGAVANLLFLASLILLLGFRSWGMRKAQNQLSDGHAQDIHSIDGEPSTN